MGCTDFTKSNLTITPDPKYFAKLCVCVRRETDDEEVLESSLEDGFGDVQP